MAGQKIAQIRHIISKQSSNYYKNLRQEFAITNRTASKHANNIKKKQIFFFKNETDSSIFAFYIIFS